MSLAAYRARVETGEEQELAHIGTLVEWLKVGEQLSPSSLRIACDFMANWPIDCGRLAKVLLYPGR